MPVKTDERIADLTDDLMTVLEGHMDELDTEELFFHSLRFMTLTLYETMDNHKEALKVLRAAMDDGIKTYIDNKGH
jgi:hypothetical protein